MQVEIESQSFGKRSFSLREGWRIAYNDWHVFLIHPDYEPQACSFGMIENHELLPLLETGSSFALKPYKVEDAS